MQLSDAVLAEDLRSLADSGPTRRLLEQAADRLERLEAMEQRVREVITGGSTDLDLDSAEDTARYIGGVTR